MRIGPGIGLGLWHGRNLAPWSYGATGALAVPPLSIAGTATRSFIPTDVGGLTLWLRADAGTSTPAGALNWADQSGLGHTAIAVSSARTPTVNATGAPGSQPCIDFVWTDATHTQAMSITTNTSTMRLAHPLVFLVCKISASNQAFACPFDGWNSNSWINNYGFYFNGATSGKFRVGDGSGHDGTSQTLTAGTWRMMTGQYDGAHISSWNSTTQLADVTYSGTITQNTNTWWLGSYTNGVDANSLFSGSIAELIVYDYDTAHAADSAIVSDVQTYLQGRYAGV